MVVKARGLALIECQMADAFDWQFDDIGDKGF